MKNLIHLLLLCLMGKVAAQSNYAAADIPKALLANANTVVRQFDVKFEVHNKGEATETEHKVLTLLNDKASSEIDQYFIYDKIVEIDDIEGAMYDGAGKLVRKLKKKDILDGKPDEHYVNDYRLKVLQFARLDFPYTIEYTVARKYNGLMFYPDFYPQSSSSEAVESASLKVVMPEGLDIRLHEINIPQNCKTGKLQWSFRNLPAYEVEPFIPMSRANLPRVLTAPTKFRLEGYDGDMSSWESYGAFIHKLNEGKQILPVETEELLKKMTADCPDARCKVERVYNYLQQNTRYFFIGLGIGGWQPMPAKNVDAFKYGDCKGLSNYTVSMLRAVGVPAFYTLIRATPEEQKGLIPNFPNAQFNHAIACVPLGTDTIWLECTSQTESCGFLGDFTDNRPALLVTPEGGKLVMTPQYDEKSNTIQRKTQLTLANNGSALLESNDIYRGIASSTLADIAEMHPEDQKKALYKMLVLSDFEIKSFSVKREKGRLPEAHRKLEISVPKFASASGKRLFVPVIALAPKQNIPEADTLRKNPIQASERPFLVEDHLTIVVPEGYSLENGIEPIIIESAFGVYELSIQNVPGKMLIYRKLLLNDSIQPKEKFEEFVTFFKNIAKADKTRLVLAKGT
jgi:Domain of Unknown Function with PDB structure (DUF3857)/Transglutaminase-like superfamily